ncbi:hypothetical protein [Haloplanus pelagicus]|jgi:hypothetical protein|uniref:hypothetical protein n=1 Tax=Haloplanus pelagicus TaxID=2949995 RepID=UPI00203D0D7E|nr:hypothetical protein [Haloplanus sp. HW8-1]
MRVRGAVRRRIHEADAPSAAYASGGVGTRPCAVTASLVPSATRWVVARPSAVTTVQ